MLAETLALADDDTLADGVPSDAEDETEELSEADPLAETETDGELDTLVLGESELGVDWILGPSSRFALYAFNVRVDQALTDEQHRQLRAIVEYLKPAHTHFVDLLEPAPPSTYDHWELGESELGVESDLQ